MMPGSAVSVRYLSTFSSVGTAATPSGMPMPRFTTPPRRQLESAPARDDLALVEGRRLDPVQRHPLPAREGVVVGRRVGLTMVLGLRHHHAVHQHAGDLHLARAQGLSRRDALDLGDDEPPRVLGRHGDGEVVEGQRLPFHGDVAGGIGGGAADQRDVDRERLVAQPGLALDLGQLDEVLRRDRVELAAAQARVDEGAKPHLGQDAGTAARRSRDRGARCSRAAGCRPRSRCRAPAAPIFGTRDQWPPTTRLSRPACASRLSPRSWPSPGAAAKTRVRSEGWPAFKKRRSSAQDQFVGRADADEARGADRVAVPDHRDGFVG